MALKYKEIKKLAKQIIADTEGFIADATENLSGAKLQKRLDDMLVLVLTYPNVLSEQRHAYKASKFIKESRQAEIDALGKSGAVRIAAKLLREAGADGQDERVKNAASKSYMGWLTEVTAIPTVDARAFIGAKDQKKAFNAAATGLTLKQRTQLAQNIVTDIFKRETELKNYQGTLGNLFNAEQQKRFANENKKAKAAVQLLIKQGAKP